MSRQRVTALTDMTLQVIRRLFADADRGLVADLLVQQCGANLPLTDLWETKDFERLRFAVLKLGDGDLVKLREAVRIAQIDWRDVLVAAGFGDSLQEHARWARTLLS
jgi:hypothetical protein